MIAMTFFCYETASQAAFERGVWSRHGKKLKLAAKMDLTKCYLMTSSTWLINAYIDCIPETDFKCYLQKRNVT